MYDLSKKDAIVWGMTQESVAVEKYRSFGDATVGETGNICSYPLWAVHRLTKDDFIFIFHTGLWLHSNGVLGASPDGLIGVPAAYGFQHQDPDLAALLSSSVGPIKPDILEVKCPYTARDMTIPEAIRNIKGFCLGKPYYDC